MAEVDTNKYLSKVVIGGQEYLIKDAAAKAVIDKLKAAAYQGVVTKIGEDMTGADLPNATAVKEYVDAQVGTINKFDVEVVEKLPEPATEKNMFILYLVADPAAEAGEYIEYICVRSGKPEAYTYKFEKIGSTKTDLSGYVKKETQIANVAINDGISVENLSAEGALNLKALAHADSATGTVEAQTISGVKATGNVTGTATVTTQDTQAVVATKKVAPTIKIKDAATATINNDVVNVQQAPEGAVQITGAVAAPKLNVTAATVTSDTLVQNAGQLPTKDADEFVAPTLKAKATADQGDVEKFAKAGMIAEMDADKETLTLTNAATADVMSAIDWSAGSYKEGAFNQGALFELAQDTTLATGIATATAEATTFTSNKYDVKLASKAIDVKDATYTNTEIDVVDTVTYAKADASAEVAANGVSLNVGDIEVTSKTVTVTPTQLP